MNDPVVWTLAWAAGVVIGLVFFGGLWWTIEQGLTSPNPALWFLTSLLLRMSVALGGFYFVSGGRWERLVACLIGFVVARLAVTWMTRSMTTLSRSQKGTQHAH